MKILRTIGFGVGIATLAAAAFWFDLFRDPELFFEDLLFSRRSAPENIAIVAIDEKSLAALGQWPWPRATFARLLDRLSFDDARPEAVGLDVNFPEASRLGPSDDALLAKAIARAPYPIVLPQEADPLSLGRDGIPRAEHVVVPRGEFRSASNVRLGVVNFAPDRDGVVRTMPEGTLLGGVVAPSFAGAVIGAPIESAGTRRIVFSGPPGTVRSVSFIDALQGDAGPSLRGSYVFIGSTVANLHDEQLTAFSRGVPMAGVEIHAQAAAMLREGWRLDALPRASVALWVFLAAFIPFLGISLIRSPRLGLGLAIATGLIHAPATILLFEYGALGNILHTMLGWAIGLGGALVVRHFVAEREKRELRHLFSKYVSRDVMEEMLRDMSRVRLGGVEADATIFFSDVRGFTTLSERLTPAELTQFLNRYFTVMTNIALQHRGVVDKYIGDAIMAFWGAPLANPDHALDAVRSALDMVDALDAFNKESAAAGGLTIDIGIGLNSGSVVAGNMGSDQRFDYTVMGDAVNLASRLEGQTKTYGVHIITSEYTIAKLSEDAMRAEGILVREVDRVRVKGKKLPVTIFEVVERARVAAVSAILSDFVRAREAYYAGSWAEVLTLGKAILARGGLPGEGDDGPTKVLLERAEHFLHEPPAAWEGVYDFKTK